GDGRDAGGLLLEHGLAVQVRDRRVEGAAGVVLTGGSSGAAGAGGERGQREHGQGDERTAGERHYGSSGIGSTDDRWLGEPDLIPYRRRCAIAVRVENAAPGAAQARGIAEEATQITVPALRCGASAGVRTARRPPGARGGGGALPARDTPGRPTGQSPARPRARGSSVLARGGAVLGVVGPLVGGAVLRVLEPGHPGLAVQRDELAGRVGPDHQPQHGRDLVVIALLVQQTGALHLRDRGADLLGEAGLVRRGGAAVGGQRLLQLRLGDHGALPA